MHHWYHSFFIVIIFLFFTSIGKAQFVNFGQDRSSLRWKQIQTNHFQIIYPDFFEENAQKIANIYARLYQHANTLQLTPQKISIVIHADGGISNGNVTLVPRKTELYTMPPQEPSTEWLEHLCVHEFRHIVQLDKINQGFTRGLSFLFGELSPIAVTGMYVPMWLMEGDAVCFESAASTMGRGRSPEFLNEMKAQIVEKGIYSLSKAVLGSKKDFVPNRYAMGYFMTANTRIHYGSDIWANTLNYVGRHPFHPRAFNKGLATSIKGVRDHIWNDSTFRSLFINPDSIKQSHTSYNTKQMLYFDHFSELQQIWKREATSIKHHFDTIPTHAKYYTNYYYPTPIGHNQLIAYKKGLRETGAFVLLSNQKEKLITRTGNLADQKFAFHHNRLVWSEYVPHPRWEQGGRMRLSSFDIISEKYKRHRGKNNQLSPFKTDDGWGYVEIDRQNQSFLVLSDSTLQREIWRFQGADGELFIHPSYANGKIFTIVQSSQGIRIESIDVHSKLRKTWIHTTNYELDNPIWVDSCLIFRASYNGRNALYQLHNGKITQLLEGKFGVRYPCYQPKDNHVYFSFYTSDGYKPGKFMHSSIQNKPAEYAHFRLADSIKRQEKWSPSSRCDTLYPSRKYHTFTHLFNIHSWGPIYANRSDMDLDIGAVVYSQNKLSTLSFSAGYVFRSGDDFGKWLLHTTYRGLWPVFSLQIESGKAYHNTTLQGDHLATNKQHTLLVHNKVQHTEASLTLQFPFHVSKKQYQSNLIPYLSYQVESIHNQDIKSLYTLKKVNQTTQAHPAEIHDYLIRQHNRFYHLLEYGLIFNNQTRMTEQEIAPRWGQILSFGYADILHQNLNLGNQWWYDCKLYFPGFKWNHSIDLYHGFQHMSKQIRSYSNEILYPRGIRLPGYEMATLRTSYRLPISYPDKQIGSFAYFKSINGCIFYDLGCSRTSIKKQDYFSFGLELSTDSHFFQLTYPIHWGVRVGYENQHRKIFTDLIFSIGFSN